MIIRRFWILSKLTAFCQFRTDFLQAARKLKLAVQFLTNRLNNYKKRNHRFLSALLMIVFELSESETES
jgi:hypothetical protein